MLYFVFNVHWGQQKKKTTNTNFLPSKERDGFGSLAVARGRGRGRGDWSVGTPGGMQEITYTVPADKCGLVIGKGRSANVNTRACSLSVSGWSPSCCLTVGFGSFFVIAGI